MKYTLKVGALENISLCENDKAKSILQNIALILSTKKGTVPMYREFGIDTTFVDKPPAIAEALARSAIAEAVENFEPRAKILNIDFENSGDFSRINTVLEVEI